MRVLLIEDDSAAARSIELMLKSETFNVYTTDLGEEGIDLGKLYDYDIILLDLTSPTCPVSKLFALCASPKYGLRS
jgi:two-component system cell cycle response regulator CtrA